MRTARRTRIVDAFTGPLETLPAQLLMSQASACALPAMARHYQGVGVGASSTHHRRQSTKSAMANGPGSVPYDELLPPANADFAPSSPSKDKMRAGGLFAFPAPTPSSHGPDVSSHVGYTSARIPSGSHAASAPLDAIYEAPNGESHRVEYASKSPARGGGAAYGPVDSSDMSPTRTRHRVSPSLPYAPVHASEIGPPRGVGRSAAASTVSGNLSQIGRVVYSNVRRGRPVDVIGLVIFAFAVLVFLSALSGMGYVDVDGPMATPPPIARPRLNTQPLAGAKAPLAAADPRRDVRGPAQAANIRKPPPKAPLVIKEDEALLAEEEASRPDWAKPHPAGGEAPLAREPMLPPPVGLVGVPMAQQAPDDRAAPVAGKRPRVVPLATDDDAIAPPRPAPANAVPEPEDHREFVRDSPNDAALDDEHAAHYHHAPDSNIFRGERGAVDLDDHAHAHAHGRHAEAVDLAQRGTDVDLDEVDAAMAAAMAAAGDDATDGIASFGAFASSRLG